MSEASRARVTITLGRSGQVVKRPVSGDDYSQYLPGVGSKRSARARLGSSSESSHVHDKRQRGDGYISGLGANGVDDAQIGKDDLRFKLMQKSVVKRAHSDDDCKFMDLRHKLSRVEQPLRSSFNARQHMPEPKESSILGSIPVTRSTNGPSQMNSSRSSYSAWTLDHIRRRSPESTVGSSRGLSPLRNREDFRRRPLSRTYDDVRAVPYMSKDVHYASRPMTTSPYMTKTTLPPGSVKPLPPGPPPLLGQLPPPLGIVQKSSYTADEQQTVDGLLHSLGLGKYAILFKAEEVDMTALKQMGENDLKELGIPMGPRKKIILALLPRSKRQP